MYEYNATILRAVDGDTLKLDIDLGMRIHVVNESARLARINAPELNTSEGKSAKEFMKQLEGQKVRIQSIKGDTGDKYNRWLVEVFITVEGLETNLNDHLVHEGYAHYQKY